MSKGLQSSLFLCLIGAVGVTVLVMMSGCGPGEDTTVHDIRVGLKQNRPQRVTEAIQSATRYPEDLLDAIAATFQLPTANWKEELRLALEASRQTNATMLQLDRRARTEGLDDRSLRRLQVLKDQYDLLFERWVAFLSGRSQEELRSAAPLVVECAVRSWKSDDPTTRSQALALIESLGEAAFEPLVRLLEDPDPTVRAAAVRGLARPEYQPEALPHLRARIGQETEYAVLQELALAFSVPNHPEAVRALLEMLQLNPDGTYVVPVGQVRAQAIDQLRVQLVRHPALVGEAIPVLLLRLADDQSFVVSRAHQVLVGLGTAAVRPALELVRSGWQTAQLSAIAQVTEDRERARRIALRNEAILVLLDLREPTVMETAAREELIRLLDESLDDEDLRGGAASALQALGAYALPVLERRLSADDLRIRAVAAQALQAIAEMRSLDTILRHLEREREAEVLVALLGAVEAMRARRALPTLVQVMESPRSQDPRVRRALIAATARVADWNRYPQETRRLSEWILSIAEDRRERESVRNDAILALGKLKPEGIALALRAILLDEKEPDLVRKNAAWALGELGSAAQEAVPAMEEILKIRREEQKDFLRRLKDLYGNVETLNERWAQLGWEADYRNFREVKVIPSLVRSEVVHALRKIRGADAVPLLIEVLEDDQRAAVREAAAFSLGELKQGTEALIRALREDEVGSVRAKAAEALGKIKSEQVVEPLLEAIRKDKYEASRRLAIVGLREAKYDRAVAGLVSLLKGEGLDEEQQLSADLFGQVRYSLQTDGSMIADQVLTTLQHEEERVRAAGIYLLGIVGAAQGVEPAIRLLREDPSPVVRREAALALGRLKRRSAVPVLLEKLTDEAEWNRIREACAWALGEVRALEAREVLRAALSSSYLPLRAEAAAALGKLLDVESAPLLARLAKDPLQIESVRTAALSALAQLGGAQAEQVAVDLLGREIGAMRIAAANAAGTLQLREAVPLLSAAFANPGESQDLRRAAASALGSVQDPAAVPVLLPSLQTEQDRRVDMVNSDEHHLLWETVHAAAANFSLPASLLEVLEDRVWDDWYSIHFRRYVPLPIGRVQDERASEVLLRILNEHGDNHVRRHAVRSMTYTGDPELVDVLLPLLKEAKTVEERRDVAWALGELGDPRAIEPLREALENDGDEAVRNNAAGALGKLGAVQELADVLQRVELSAGTQIAILNALRELGAKAAPALGAVEAKLDHERGDVAFAALRARAAITGSPLGS
ncbi:MAG: hypothetical protein KatS3mg115_1019 [Candidatus Poribacteria bacterium]|nr:MAG: hypothetical protein KatS3mg115_1019 [Candidatus Poribacteria bacterium]